MLVFGERLGRAQLAGGAAVIAGALVVSRYAQARGRARAATGGVAALAARRRRRRGRVRRADPGDGAARRPRSAASARSASSTSPTSCSALPLALAFAHRPARRRRGARLAAGRWRPAFFETAGFACITLGARFAPLALVSPFASLASALTVALRLGGPARAPRARRPVGAALVCAGVVILAL